MNREKHEVIDNVSDRDDPLHKYPRIMMPHRWDETSLLWMIDARLKEWMTRILGREPYAVQTMFYFKPPGARGQALHQDQFYLRVDPGTCVAAWMAIDRCDEENGCLRIVPGTQDLPVLCTVDADTEVSFVNDTVELPPGYEPIPLVMDPGDVLFFTDNWCTAAIQLHCRSFPLRLDRPLHRRRSRSGGQVVSSGAAHGWQ